MEADWRLLIQNKRFRAKGSAWMSWIPEARSVKWWIIAGVSSVLLILAIWFIRFELLGQTWTNVHAFRFALFAIMWSVLLSLAGWSGGRWLWLCSNIGILVGLIFMGLYSGNATGWEDLVSLLSFMIMIISGLAVGIVVELILMTVRFVRK
ncbi:hypothetical protein [Paenibacillus sp. GSMTC-2017]|uniref:hypothetical protein n=1 Tax=Paenibacillus sp. GSMTC-2017 TaxID=2794350 RepID=UPI001E5C43CD|nr:hypothetical protein [Paenibacillus sp. GSMTC-2017]